VVEARIYTRIIPTLINNIKVRLGGARAKRKPSRVIKNFSTPLLHRMNTRERERKSEGEKQGNLYTYYTVAPFFDCRRLCGYTFFSLSHVRAHTHTPRITRTHDRDGYTRVIFVRKPIYSVTVVC